VIASLSEIRLGTLADWIAAVGTVGAFAVTSALLIREIRIHRAQKEEQDKVQARQVAAWLDLRAAPGDAVENPPGLVTEMVFKNGSEEPIYGVRVTVVARDSPFASDPDAATWPSAGTVRGTMGLLPPGQIIRHLAPGVPTNLESLALGLSFSDVQGRRWKRLPTGALQATIHHQADAYARRLEDDLG
jgi:hypothetical protein